MTDVLKLKAAIVLSGFTQQEIADKLGLSATAFNNKLRNKTEFKSSEIQKLREILKIKSEEVENIFFAKKVE